MPRALALRRLLHVVVDGEPRATAAAINTRLIGAGVTVWHLQLLRPSLEQRFLQITSTVGAAT